MANINFVNNTLIPGFTFNPGLEDVLIPTGTLSHTDGLTLDTFTITNNSGGPFNGFQFVLTSNTGGTGNFTFNGDGTPSGGTITGITVLGPAPDNTPIIQVDNTGGFGNTGLVNFYNALVNLTAPSPLAAVMSALNSLLGGTNEVTGSNIADHLSAFGFSTNKLVGNGGDDFLRVGVTNDFVTYNLVAGANEDGSGGAGETNTLVVQGRGSFVGVDFDTITNINALRFVNEAPPVAPVIAQTFFSVQFEVGQIGAGLVSPTLAVEGLVATSPLDQISIGIGKAFDPSDATPVNLDLSGWIFTNWNEERSGIEISTNEAVALNDQVTGTMVADGIGTHAGDDIIRGFGGADFLFGGGGNDTFVYGLNEAVSGEEVSGGFEGGPGGPPTLTPDASTDRILLLADNDFTGVSFESIEQFVFGAEATATFSQDFINNSSEGSGGQRELSALIPTATVVGDGNANTLAFVLQNLGNIASGIDLSDVIFQSWTEGVDKVTINGTSVRDAISGSTEGDLIDGEGGSDILQGNGGKDIFLFDVTFGQGVDHIADFFRKDDTIELDKNIFSELKTGELKKKFFTFGTKAKDKNDHIIYDKADGVLRYDDDGSGKHKAHIVAILDDAASLKAGDIFVI